jgi:hypothetical protein
MTCQQTAIHLPVDAQLPMPKSVDCAGKYTARDPRPLLLETEWDTRLNNGTAHYVITTSMWQYLTLRVTTDRRY